LVLKIEVDIVHLSNYLITSMLKRLVIIFIFKHGERSEAVTGNEVYQITILAINETAS